MIVGQVDPETYVVVCDGVVVAEVHLKDGHGQMLRFSSTHLDPAHRALLTAIEQAEVPHGD